MSGMPRNLQRWFFAWGALFVTCSASAAEPNTGGGALPKGKKIKQGVSRPDAIVEQVDRQKAPGGKCFRAFAAPLTHHGVFAGDNHSLFYMVNKGEAEGEAKQRKFQLYSIDADSGRAEPRAAISLSDGHSLISHGEPIRGLTAIQFAEDAEECASGKAQLVTLRIAGSNESNNSKAVRSAGEYSIVEGSEHPFLFDIKKKTIMETDVNSFQTRPFVPVAIAEKDRPLFVEGQSKKYWVWRTAKDGNKILTMQVNRELAKLAIDPKDKLSWYRGGVSTVRADESNNGYRIQEWGADLKPLSDQKNHITLPSAFSASGAFLEIHHGKKLVLVQPGDRSGKLRWRRIFVYDYKKGQEVATADASAGTYIYQGMFSPDASILFVELRDENTDATTSLKLLHIADGKWIDVALDKGKDKAKDKSGKKG